MINLLARTAVHSVEGALDRVHPRAKMRETDLQTRFLVVPNTIRPGPSPHLRTRHFPHRLLKWSVLITLVVAGLPATLHPQNPPIVNLNNLTTVPTPGMGHDYLKSLTETVDPANGSLSVRIGVPTPRARGISLEFAFAYDTDGIYNPFLGVVNQPYDDAYAEIGWAATPPPYLSSGGWSVTWPVATWTKTTGEITVDGHSYLCTIATNYMFMDSEGGRYPLYVSNGGGDTCSPTGDPPAYNGTGGQGPLLASLQEAGLTQGYNGSLTVTDGDGTIYQFQGPVYSGNSTNYATVASSITDRNGNYITILDNGNGVVSATDTVARPIVATSGFGNPSTNAVTVAGTPQPYQISWETLNPAFTLPVTSDPSDGCYARQSNNSLSVVQAITLPNGQQYAFLYDSTYGLLKQITYPSGAVVTYTWGTASQANQGRYTWPFGPTEPGSGQEEYQGTCIATLDTPVVTDRYVYANGPNSPFTRHDNFAYTTDWNYSTDGQPWKTTTVTSTDGTYSRTVVYSYSPYDPPQQPWENGPPTTNGQTTYIDPAVPLEISAKYEDGSGNVLQTVSETWNNPRVMTSQQTLMSGQISTAIRCFNNYEQVTLEDEYGFASDGSAAGPPSCPAGSGDGSPLSPAGPLMRQTITTYPSTLQGRNIVDRPQSVERDGKSSSGTWVAPAAYTMYCYDQNTLSPVTPVQFADPGTTVRGNVTQMLKWLNPAGGSNALPSCGEATSSNALVSNYYFDGSGQLLKSVDPAGNQTKYAWGEATGEPANTTTNGFLLTVTNPFSYSESYTWNWANGVMTSHSDLNSQTTHFYYTNLLTNEPDSFNRIGTIDYPDNGETRVYYGDSPGDLYAEVQRQVAASVNTDSYTYLDDLGRTINTASADGNGAWNCTQMTYDGFGEKSFVSYPYTSGSSTCLPNSTGDNSVYDALGREIQLTHSPDGSSQVWTYSGSTVKFQDENGNQWQRTSDGIGRLTQVLEPNGIVQTPSMATTYTYDALDNLFSVNQAGSGPSTARVRSFVYDSLSRLTSGTNPESGTTTYGYDADGNLILKTSPAVNVSSGTQSIGYCYDALNRLTYKFYSGSFNCSSPAGYSAAYAYDTSSISNPSNVIGRLTYEASLVNGHLVSERFPYQYDAMGRLQAEEQCTLTGCTGNPPTCSFLCVPAIPYTVSYQYDWAGNLKYSSNGMGIAPPGASAPLTFSSQYDAGGHIQCLTSSWNDSTHPGALFAAQTTASSPCGQTVSASPYTPFGALQNAVFGNGTGNGIVLNRSYDSRMRILGETDTGRFVSTQ